MKLTVNPEYEKILPKLSVEEFNALKDSIKEDGQLVPIIINEKNVILDGHNRWQVCQALKIEPKIVIKTFANKFLEKKFVIVINLKRRHLNDFQRAEMGMELLPIEKALAKERQGHKTSPSFKKEVGGDITAVGQVAKQVGLSETTFSFAKKIIEEAPEAVKEQLRQEELSISGAYENLQLTKDLSVSIKPKIEEKIEEIKTTMRAEKVGLRDEKQRVITKLVEVQEKKGTITDVDIKRTIALTKVETLMKDLPEDVQKKTIESITKQVEKEGDTAKTLSVIKEVGKELTKTLEEKGSITSRDFEEAVAVVRGKPTPTERMLEKESEKEANIKQKEVESTQYNELKLAIKELNTMADTLSKRITDMKQKGKHALAEDFGKLQLEILNLIDKYE